MNSYNTKNYYNFSGLKEYALNKCLRLPLNEYIVIDIETTGLTHSSEIIEVCALHIQSGNIISKYNSLIDYPERKTLPKKITELTGITLDMMREEGGYVEDVLKSLKNFIGDKPICCHNAKFDLIFLQNKFDKYIESSINNDFIDTLYISREFLSNELPNHKLPTIAKHFGIDTINLHRAEGDCIITYQIYEKLKEFLKPEFDDDNVNYEEFKQEHKPISCSKILLWLIALIALPPITISYYILKYVNSGKFFKIVLISIIWLIFFIISLSNLK